MVHLPSKMNLDEGDLPELKEWKVGDTYKIEVQAKLLSLRQNDPMLEMQGDKDASKMHADFQVMGAETDDEKEPPEKDKEDKKKALKEAVESYKK